MSRGGTFLRGLMETAAPLLTGCRPGCRCEKHRALNTLTELSVGMLEEGARARRRAKAPPRPPGAPQAPTGAELVRPAFDPRTAAPALSRAPVRDDTIDVEFEEVAPAPKRAPVPVVVSVKPPKRAPAAKR